MVELGKGHDVRDGLVGAELHDAREAQRVLCPVPAAADQLWRAHLVW